MKHLWRRLEVIVAGGFEEFDWEVIVKCDIVMRRLDELGTNRNLVSS